MNTKLSSRLKNFRANSIRPNNTQSGFTLVELLVVIAIIGILIGMLLPAVQMVRESARRSACANNMRQVGLAILNYESANETLPSGWNTNDPMDAAALPGWGWSATILPFLEGNDVHDRLNFDIAIDDPSNLEFIKTPLAVYQCTSDPADIVINLDQHIEHGHSLKLDEEADHDELWAGRSNYSGVFGSLEIEATPLMGDGVFYANSEIPLAYIKDGLSNTMIVGERRNDFGANSWVGVIAELDEPFSRIVGAADHAPNSAEGHFEDFRSYHPGGINVVMADGSVQFVKNVISEAIFRALATKDGGETAFVK